MARGLSNNNPGNIVKSSGAAWLGEIRPSKDVRFAQFSSMEYGYRALFRLLQNYSRLHGCNTVRKMITRWAPPAENHTAAYIKFTSDRAGVSADAVIDVTDKAVMLRLAAAITEMENGQKADEEAMKRGWELL
jgi:hypothetical protein